MVFYWNPLLLHTQSLVCATADSRCLDFRVFGICYFERWLKTLHFCLPKNVLVKFISKHDAPLPTLALSSNIPFLEKKWILFTQEKTYVCHFLFVCFIYYIIIIILDCILISLIDFFLSYPLCHLPSHDQMCTITAQIYI